MIAELSPYPRYRPTGVEWLGEVPLDWGICRLKTFVHESDRRKGDSDLPLLSLTRRRGIVRHDEFTDRIASAADLTSYRVCVKGSLVMNRMQAWSGMFAISPLTGVVSPDYSVFDVQGVDPAFLEASLKSPIYVSEFARRSKGIGSGFNRLYNDDFGATAFALPSPEDQAAIVRYLDHIDSRIERFIAAKERLIELLEEEKRAIVHHAVTSGLDADAPVKPSGTDWLGEVPKDWEVLRLKYAFRLQRGHDLPADDRRPGPIPVVSSGGVIGRHDEARTKGPGVVVGRYGSTEAVYFLSEDFWPHNTALYVTRFFGNDPEWVYRVLQALPKAELAAKSAVPGVDRRDLHELKVAVPPASEQARLCAHLRDALSEVGAAAAATRRQVDLAREFRTRLVSDVVTGKLDVRVAAQELPEPSETSRQTAECQAVPA